MVRRKLHRELPWFFAYTLFDAVQSASSWFLRHHMPLYFYIYWICELVLVVAAFAVIYEVFRNLVKDYTTIHRAGFWLYRLCAVALLVLATMAVAKAPQMNSAAIIDGIFILERGVRIVQAGLLFFLFLFASYLGLSWRNSVFGIALGFGLFASMELAVVAIRSHVGNSLDSVYVFAKSLCYNCAVLIWFVYLLQRQPTTQPVTSVPKTDIAVWDQTLTEFLRR